MKFNKIVFWYYNLILEVKNSSMLLYIDVMGFVAEE